MSKKPTPPDKRKALFHRIRRLENLIKTTTAALNTYQANLQQARLEYKELQAQDPRPERFYLDLD